MKKLLLIGGGGHCKSVIDSLLSRNSDFERIGIIDVSEKVGEDILGVKIIGTDSDLENLYSEGYVYAFITIGSVGNPEKRKQIYHRIKKIGYIVPNIIDSESVIGKNIQIGEGVFVGKRAVINSGTQIDNCAIINTGAIIEHDCKIGEFTHVSPGCVICGGVAVGDYAHVGANATIIQGISVGDCSIVGAGSTIIHNVGYGETIVGNPGRKIR